MDIIQIKILRQYNNLWCIIFTLKNKKSITKQFKDYYYNNDPTQSLLAAATWANNWKNNNYSQHIATKIKDTDTLHKNVRKVLNTPLIYTNKHIRKNQNAETKISGISYVNKEVMKKRPNGKYYPYKKHWYVVHCSEYTETKVIKVNKQFKVEEDIPSGKERAFIMAKAYRKKLIKYINSPKHKKMRRIYLINKHNNKQTKGELHGAITGK
jgi:hypothetical protein